METRLEALEDENSTLQRQLGEQMPDMAAMKELLPKMVAPTVKRDAVAHLQALFGLSERRACQIAEAERKMERTSRNAHRTGHCGAGRAIWPMNGAGLATDGSLCRGGARWCCRVSTTSIGAKARKG
jgi:hypothetical protein